MDRVPGAAAKPRCLIHAPSESVDPAGHGREQCALAMNVTVRAGAGATAR
jgi:hypothetical protein